MNDFNTMHTLYHSEIAKRELERQKRSLEVLNTDFYNDLPDPIRGVLEHLRWNYSNRKWFNEAWEEYRKHVLEAGLGGKIKMPGAIFNKYLDKYESKELEKIYPEVLHSEELCEDYLAHHGIKGQKWGMRRFQNEDGTLTEAGKARYNEDLTKKDPKKMSMQDLQKSNARLQAEKNYEQLSKNNNSALKKNASLVGHTAMAAAVTFVGTFAALKLKDYIMAYQSGDALPGPKAESGKEWLFRNSGKLLASSLMALTAAVSTLGGRVGQN